MHAVDLSSVVGKEYISINVYLYVCMCVCAFAHICMSGGNLILNVLRFWVELRSLLHDLMTKV